LYVLGNDVNAGMPEWDIFIKEIRKEMTVKAGQKCTGIRRILFRKINGRCYEGIDQGLIQKLPSAILKTKSENGCTGGTEPAG